MVCAACELVSDPDASYGHNPGTLLTQGAITHRATPPTWMPDGSEIVYMADFWRRIEAISVGTRVQRTVAPMASTGTYTQAIPSPSGDAVYAVWLVEEPRRGKSLLRYSRGEPSVWFRAGIGGGSIPPNGLGLSGLPLTGSDDVAFVVSPDSLHVRSDQGAERFLALGCYGLVETSPDGKDAICLADISRYAIFDLEGGRRTPLPLDPQVEGRQTLNFHWSSAGIRVFYVDHLQPTIYEVSAETSRPLGPGRP